MAAECGREESAPCVERHGHVDGAEPSVVSVFEPFGVPVAVAVDDGVRVAPCRGAVGPVVDEAALFHEVGDMAGLGALQRLVDLLEPSAGAVPVPLAVRVAGGDDVAVVVEVEPVEFGAGLEECVVREQEAYARPVGLGAVGWVVGDAPVLFPAEGCLKDSALFRPLFYYLPSSFSRFTSSTRPSSSISSTLLSILS